MHETTQTPRSSVLNLKNVAKWLQFSARGSNESSTIRARQVAFAEPLALGRIIARLCRWRYKAVGFTTLEKLVFLGHVLPQVVGVWHLKFLSRVWSCLLQWYLHLNLFCSKSVEDFVDRLVLCCPISSRFSKHFHNSEFICHSGMPHSSIFSFSWK